MKPPALLFGVPLDDLTMSDALDQIGDLIEHGRRTGRSHQIATVNVDFIVNALGDDGVLEMLQRSALNLNDGMPLVWAARALSMQQRERVAGSDLVPALGERAAQLGWKVHLFGAPPGVADRAAELLRSRHPTLKITSETGPMISDVHAIDEAVLRDIAAVDADVLCVALGNPKQERFIAAHRERLGTPVMVGIGGSLEMLLGDLRRAPEWAQRAGLEWLFRAAQEPRRLGRRYARDAFVFGPRLVAHARKVRRTLDGPGVTISIDGSGNAVRLTAGPSLAPESQWEAAADAIASGAKLLVDVEKVETLDIRAVAQLSGLIRLASRSSLEWPVRQGDIALTGSWPLLRVKT